MRFGAGRGATHSGNLWLSPENEAERRGDLSVDLLVSGRLFDSTEALVGTARMESVDHYKVGILAFQSWIISRNSSSASSSGMGKALPRPAGWLESHRLQS